MTYLLLDIMVILILWKFWKTGFRYGAVRSLIYFAGSAVAIGTSAIFSGKAANLLYEFFIKDVLAKKISLATMEKSSEKIICMLPKILRPTASVFGITQENIGKIIEKSNADKIILELVSPIVISFLQIICSTVIFFLLMMFAKLFASRICKIFKFQILSQINGFLGGILGISKGVCVLWAIFSIMKLIFVLSGNIPSFLSEKIIESTHIFKYIYNFGFSDGFPIESKISIYDILPTSGSKRTVGSSLISKFFRL
jgi:uncharacterized membrane protein required for colicin V production